MASSPTPHASGVVGNGDWANLAQVAAMTTDSGAVVGGVTTGATRGSTGSDTAGEAQPTMRQTNSRRTRGTLASPEADGHFSSAATSSVGGARCDDRE